MDYKIIHDITSDDLFELRKLNGWKEISIEQLERGLSNTMCKVSIKNSDTIIACGRLVGDFSCKGVLSDILVNPEYQRRGFGKIIVGELLNIVSNSLKKGEKFQIEATPTSGNRDFYIKCGLKYKPENQDGVYIWIEK